MKAKVKFDPIELEIVSNRLVSITDDMHGILVRSSFSPNIKERKDCSVALFDSRGRMIAQGSHVPLHLGSLMGSMKVMLEKIDPSTIADGDCFISNDAYLAGGTHLPDIAIVSPVFVEGELRFFTANIGHHGDIGGPTPGGMSHSARDVFDEGLRIPLMRIARAGVVDSGLLEMIAVNTREPDERKLDLNVQIATNRRGTELVRDLALKMGRTAMDEAVDDLLAYTEARMRKCISDLPDGVYHGQDELDDDGVGDMPVPINVAVTVKGGSLTFDFAGTGPQSRGGLNVAESALHATCYYAVKSLLDPEIAPNSGMFAPISITAPERSILNPRFPAAVGTRTLTTHKISGAIFDAFAAMGPQTAMAASHNASTNIVISGYDAARSKHFVYLDVIGGGAGATASADGMSGVQVHHTNTPNLPIEILETEYPLRVSEYALATGSGGTGRRAGGMGIVREIEVLQDGLQCMVRTETYKSGARGVLGGGDGKPSRVVFDFGRKTEKEMPSKVEKLIMGKGERIRVVTPGGGALGTA